LAAIVVATACSAVGVGVGNNDAGPPDAPPGRTDASRDASDAGVDVGRDGADAAADGSRDASDGSSDGRSEADGDAETGCSPGTEQCSEAGILLTCGADGGFGDPWPCASGACGNAGCIQPSSTAATSCASSGPGLDDCGEAGTESCCTSLEVPTGTFYRSYGSEPDGGPTGEADPATLSGFRLDKYDVTVGRFRQFVNAVMATDAGVADGGWVPADGSGKHAHLNDGRGLANGGSSGGYETGWVATDDVNIAPLDSNLGSCAPYSTWTNPAATQENLPINCVNWYESYAFCIWDGGFLPSDAEWEYASAGGGGATGQREYSWGAIAPGASNEYAIYGCNYPFAADGGCTGIANVAPVGTATLGSGAWGQLDLAGNMYQWDLDWYAAYVNPCVDCANLTPLPSGRVIRGGDFYHSTSVLLTTSLYDFTPTNRNYFVGFRCARPP
jgi:formylglycine-generating enzyme